MSLSVLHLSGNRLVDSLSLCVSCCYVSRMVLCGLKLSEQVSLDPMPLCALTNLRELDLCHNQLQSGACVCACLLLCWHCNCSSSLCDVRVLTAEVLVAEEVCQLALLQDLDFRLVVVLVASKLLTSHTIAAPTACSVCQPRWASRCLRSPSSRSHTTSFRYLSGVVFNAPYST
jgi:hypothetical protein